ncbi:MAG TPA: hypothetical protein VIX59_08060 [Candidatus Binataceae bacterium]
MNLIKKNNLPRVFAALGLATFAFAVLPLVFRSIARAAEGKGLDVEVPYEIKALKSSGLTAPAYLATDGNKLIVSDRAGGVFSVTMAGKATALADKSKLPHPAGVAIAPAGFGAYGGQTFVLAAPAADGPCEVDRIDKSGAVSTFAKLPDNGSVGGGKPTECRALEFGPTGSLYAGKLFAATTGNETLYAVDSSGKASAFSSFDKPIPFEISTIAFAPADDSKAPGMMLLGMRPTSAGAARVGRIGVVMSDGKVKDDPYLVGFTRPGGIAFAPTNFGAYSSQLFVADTGRLASENSSGKDGNIERVEKGLARPWGGGLVDPTDMKFVGSKLVIADPAEKGRPDAGAIVIITSLL